MRAHRVLPLLLMAACVQVNPSSRYACTTEDDCGPGYDCIARFEGSNLCFREGECVEGETCNGADDNCDGRIDETFPELGEACTTTQLGVCAAGTRTCEVGQLGCAATRTPMAEACDQLDNDCDGQVDEIFDFTSDEGNCGACGTVCVAGTTCLASRCEETTCDDGLDNDGDGARDCDDDGCLGQVCVTPMPPPWRCGVLRVTDAGFPDAGDPDAGAPDAGDPDAGETDAGETDAGVADAGEPDAGAADAGAWDGGPLRGCYAPEGRCDNGFDDDGDGETDCTDVDCAGLRCASGNSCTNRACPP